MEAAPDLLPLTVMPASLAVAVEGIDGAVNQPLNDLSDREDDTAIREPRAGA